MPKIFFRVLTTSVKRRVLKCTHYLLSLCMNHCSWPMLQRRPNRMELRSMDSSIQILCNVKSRVLTRLVLEAHVGLFRLLMKGIFGPYVL